VWALPGTPYVNDAAAYGAITHARTTGQPFLGTCGGFQYAMVEYARTVAGWPLLSGEDVADMEHHLGAGQEELIS
jgi:CTP synthase (UTP-ammonia lyase)